MGRNKTTKTEKLLNRLHKTKGGMTRKEMVTFLLKLDGYDYDPGYDRGTYNSTLYGNTRCHGGYIARPVGILPTFCQKTEDGKWKLRKNVKPRRPFVSVDK